MKYIIITPVQNEEKYIRLTLESVTNQTVLPLQWVIVNDGSTDRTGEIVSQYANRFPWIKLVNRVAQGSRERGGHIIDIFYEGFRTITEQDYQYIAKLDGDLSFAPDYFEKLFDRFLQDPRLGIAGGECYFQDGKSWRIEKTRSDHVRGATKVYRRECFEEIGGIPPVIGWDGIDEWRAQMKGWRTQGFEDLPVLHHRPVGYAEGKLKGYTLGGRIASYLGYPLAFVIARAVYRSIVGRPPLIGGAAFLASYLRSQLKSEPRFDDPELLEYIRRVQMNRLLPWKHSPKKKG
jgi:glycosyltransferase involved in cell wall biosynthesis